MIAKSAPEYGGQPAAELELLVRLNYGAWLSRRLQLPILVTSDPRNVAAMAVELSRGFQTPARWVDPSSHDTFENARNCAALLSCATRALNPVGDEHHTYAALRSGIRSNRDGGDTSSI